MEKVFKFIDKNKKKWPLELSKYFYKEIKFSSILIKRLGDAKFL